MVSNALLGGLTKRSHAAQFTNNGNDTAIAWTTLGSAMGYLLTETE